MTHADLLFTGGHVFHEDGQRHSELAVADGRILAVGGRGDLRDLVGTRTEVVPLDGRLLLPGFQDAHIHAVMGGVELGQCDLTGTTDRNEYLRRIREYAAAHPGAEWIVGGGWSMESFENGVPDRHLLDQGWSVNRKRGSGCGARRACGCRPSAASASGSGSRPSQATVCGRSGPIMCGRWTFSST